MPLLLSAAATAAQAKRKESCAGPFFTVTVTRSPTALEGNLDSLPLLFDNCDDVQETCMHGYPLPVIGHVDGYSTVI